MEAVSAYICQTDSSATQVACATVTRELSFLTWFQVFPESLSFTYASKSKIFKFPWLHQQNLPGTLPPTGS